MTVRLGKRPEPETFREALEELPCMDPDNCGCGGTECQTCALIIMYAALESKVCKTDTEQSRNATMSESAIPSMTAADVAPVSPEVAAQRKRVELAYAAFASIGAMPIKAIEAEKAVELLKYLDNEWAAECKILDGIIASEALGKPVEVNGSVVKLAQVQH